MALESAAEVELPSPPQVSHLITEDDTPVDNMPSEKQQRLLTEPLYSSWSGPGAGRIFLAAANVGVFPVPRNPAIVPDVFLVIPTGRERAEEEHRRAEHAEQLLAEERRRAERLAALLRRSGLDPEQE